MTTANAETTTVTESAPSYVNENRRHIYSAVLFSGFPDDVINKNREELLVRYGVNIEEVMPITRQRGLKDAMQRHDLVLLHHEMSSHKDTGRIKKFAKALDKEVIPISRKSAAWEEQLKYKLTAQPPTTSVVSKRVIPEENIEGFLRDYMVMKEKGFSLTQMQEPLSKYRSSGKFERNQQIAVIIAKMGDHAPQWFRDWEKGVKEPVATPVETEATSAVIPEGLTAEVPPAIIEEQPKIVNHEDESKELARLYQNEADNLRARVAELEDKNKHLTAGSKAWAKGIVDAVNVLVENGAITRDAGFEMIAAAVSK